MKRSTWTAVPGCILALVLAGCGATSVSGQASPAAGQTRSPVSSPTGATTTSPPPASASPAPGQARGPSGLLGFMTPSGNIACYVASGTPGNPSDPGQARCDIGQATWDPPPRPGSCVGDWGHSLTVGPDGSGFGCVTDSAANDNVVSYGSTQVRGAFSCAVDQSGVTCTDLDTGHGFAVSRDRYQLF